MMCMEAVTVINPLQLVGSLVTAHQNRRSSAHPDVLPQCSFTTRKDGVCSAPQTQENKPDFPLLNLGDALHPDITRISGTAAETNRLTAVSVHERAHSNLCTPSTCVQLAAGISRQWGLCCARQAAWESSAPGPNPDFPLGPAQDRQHTQRCTEHGDGWLLQVAMETRQRCVMSNTAALNYEPCACAMLIHMYPCSRTRTWWRLQHKPTTDDELFHLR